MYVILVILAALAALIGLCVHTYFKHDVRPRAAYRRSLRKTRRSGETPKQLSA